MMRNEVLTWRIPGVCGVFACLLGLVSCRVDGDDGRALPPFGHVVVVVIENANYEDVVASDSAMPYLRSLAHNFGLATQYYANTHPSIGNYMMLVTGQVLTNDSGAIPATFPVSVDNAVRGLLAAGKTWRAYAEGLPEVGYLGGDVGTYAVRHVPFAYLSDVQDSAEQRQNLVPFSRFAADLQAGELPDYSFVAPDLCNDAHDCGLAFADRWLQENIEPILQDPVFKDDGLLIVTFDESGTDNSRGGGRVATVLASPAYSKSGYRSDATYQHESVLRLSLEALGVSSLPGAAQGAPEMSAFFCWPPGHGRCR